MKTSRAGEACVDRSIGARRAARQVGFANDLADGILAGIRRRAAARGEELNVDEAAWRKRVADIVGDVVYEDAGHRPVSSLSDRRRLDEKSRPRRLTLRPSSRRLGSTCARLRTDLVGDRAASGKTPPVRVKVDGWTGDFDLVKHPCLPTARQVRDLDCLKSTSSSVSLWLASVLATIKKEFERPADQTLSNYVVTMRNFSGYALLEVAPRPGPQRDEDRRLQELSALACAFNAYLMSATDSDRSTWHQKLADLCESALDRPRIAAASVSAHQAQKARRSRSAVPGKLEPEAIEVALRDARKKGRDRKATIAALAEQAGLGTPRISQLARKIGWTARPAKK